MVISAGFSTLGIVGKYEILLENEISLFIKLVGRGKNENALQISVLTLICALEQALRHNTLDAAVFPVCSFYSIFFFPQMYPLISLGREQFVNRQLL